MVYFKKLSDVIVYDMAYLRLIKIRPNDAKRLKRGARVVFHLNTFPSNIKLILDANKFIRRYRRFLTAYQIERLLPYYDPYYRIGVRALVRLPTYEDLFL